ncbi:MAG: thermonuclease family protein [Candidatus Izemoplasmatales bacterium]|jgi:endonuclease YncB( thermonuclease family)|nr:thermonuclease family protein [bacterium]MDZ4196543.1 thermonuclease family protein [Candidatus Izemoplasmatales bacterium]
MKRFIAVIITLMVGFLMVSCQETSTTTVDDRILLVDISGKTEAQIQSIYEGKNINLVFRYVQTNDVTPGLFIRYVNNEIGDLIQPGNNVRVEIATQIPTTVDPRITLVDVAGKTQAEIVSLYASANITITFTLVETTTIASGLFVRYVANEVGALVQPGTTIEIEIAVDSRISLVDATGKTQAEIVSLYANKDITITFTLVETNTIASGLFIRYIDYEAGDFLQPGSNVTIEIATPVIQRVTILDVLDKTEAEILTLYENSNITITFVLVESSTITPGLFIRYVSYVPGDVVLPGTTVQIEIAKQAPAPPIVFGLEDVSLYVSVQGNPPTFDLWAGVSAIDYLGNPITPNGNFFYIIQVRDSSGNVLPTGVNYYRLGTYIVTYVAQTGALMTSVERKIHIIVPQLSTKYTDELRLTESYVGKSFIDNGIGIVTVTTYTDADTTNFRDSVTGTRFTVRYLGIDAPEATSKYDPWGIKAGNFVRDLLASADQIILQAEGPNRTDGNGRYLAWVWYVKNGVTRLLNLELVEQAYAWVSGAGTTQYGTTFTVAAAEAQITGQRIYGEIDPDYDYSTEGTPIEIGTLIQTFAQYIGKKVTVTGIITSKVGNSVYVESAGQGIFIYTGFSFTNELQIGYEVTIQGLVAAEYFGSKQLSNYSYSNMQLLSTDNEVIITTITGNQMGSYVGRVVRFLNLRITSIDPSPTNIAYTVYAVDALGNSINIRVDAYTASFLPSHLFVVGNYIDIFGPVTQYYQTYQLMLPGSGNVTFK